MKTPLKADAYCVYDADGAILISDEDYGEGEREVLAELVRRANAHDQMVEALEVSLKTIDGLADQQAMQDESYVAGREQVVDALEAAKGGDA